MTDRDSETESGAIGRALTHSLAGVPVTAEDAAIVALARAYAETIDNAQVLADSFADIDWSGFAHNQRTWRRFEAIEAAVRVGTVRASLGPKLLAVLKELQMTPAAREQVRGGAVVESPVDRAEPVADAAADEIGSLRAEWGPATRPH